MTSNYQSVNNLKVSGKLLAFVNEELLEGTDIPAEKFWLGFDKAVHELAPINRELIKSFENLSLKDTGKFFNYDGTLINF